jgi:tetratricopeptide (TPR) repeat protein
VTEAASVFLPRFALPGVRPARYLVPIAMRRGAFSFLLLVLSALWMPCVALAQAHEPPPEAMTLFESARAHYRAGEYAEAATDLENALVLDPAAPTLLFNLARVYELQNDYPRAIAAYRHLLTVTPAAQTEERQRTQEAIARLSGAAEHAPPPQESDDDRGPTFVRERGVADMPFWATFIAGGVVGLAAIGVGIGALVIHGQGDSFVLGADGTVADRESFYSLARDLGTAADVLGAIGTAALIASGLLFILREHTYEQWSASLSITPNAAAIMVGGVF